MASMSKWNLLFFIENNSDACTLHQLIIHLTKKCPVMRNKGERFVYQNRMQMKLAKLTIGSDSSHCQWGANISRMTLDAIVGCPLIVVPCILSLWHRSISIYYYYNSREHLNFIQQSDKSDWDEFSLYGFVMHAHHSSTASEMNTSLDKFYPLKPNLSIMLWSYKKKIIIFFWKFSAHIKVCCYFDCFCCCC